MNDNTSPALRLILGRRSIRVYSPGEIPEDSVDQLLRAGMAAPSAMTKDPWRFVVVRQREMLRQFTAALPGGAMLSTASVAVAVCGDLDAAFERQASYLLQDCSACIENMLLAAHGLGLGACWVGVHPSQPAMNRLRELLKIPANVLPIAVIALGKPGEHQPSRTRYNQDYVHQEKW